MSHVYIHIVSRIIYSVFSAWYQLGTGRPSISHAFGVASNIFKFFSQKKIGNVICDRERVKVSAQFAIICFIKQFR